MARNKLKEDNKFYKNARQILVANTLNCSLKEANDFLDYYFNEVLLKHKNYRITRGSGDFYHMPAQNFIIKVSGDPTLKYYICNKCHRVTTVNLSNKCPKLKCNGQLEEVKNNTYFKPVTPDDITELNSYFDNFEGWLEYVEYKDKYDFQRNDIDTEDYFYIKNDEISEKHKYWDYDVYFFDVQTKTLFFIHNNI
jgi:hypothetical protein